MSGSTLVSTGELAGNLAKWRVFDCRHDLAKPELGEQQYKQCHIPGALFASLDRDLSGRKTGRNGRHPLPEPQDFEKWLEKTGLTPKDQVVCYDGGPGAMAARRAGSISALGGTYEKTAPSPSRSWKVGASPG